MKFSKAMQPASAAIVKTMKGPAIASSIAETRHFVELMEQTYGAGNVRVSAAPLSEGGHSFTVTLPLERDELAAFSLGNTAQDLFERISAIAVEVYGYSIWTNNPRRKHYLKSAFWCYRVLTNLILEEEFNSESAKQLDEILSLIPNQIDIAEYDERVAELAKKLDSVYTIGTLYPSQQELYSKFVRRTHREFAEQIATTFHMYGLSPAAQRFPAARQLWHEAQGSLFRLAHDVPHHISRDTLSELWSYIRKLQLQSAYVDDVRALERIIIDLYRTYKTYA